MLHKDHATETLPVSKCTIYLEPLSWKDERSEFMNSPFDSGIDDVIKDRWLLRGRFGFLEAVSVRGLPSSTAVGDFNRSLLDNAVRDPASQRALTDMYLKLQGPGSWPAQGMTEDDFAVHLRRTLQSAFRRGSLAVFTEPLRPLPRTYDFPVPPQKHTAFEPPAAPYLIAMAGSGIVGPPTTFPAFTEGPAIRPNIKHDHGFLDDGNGNIDNSKRRAATFEDYRKYVWWDTKLEGAQVLRPDLKDATDAYSNFLHGDGAQWNFSYDKFVRGDSSGKTVLESAIEDVRSGAIAIHDKKVPTPPASQRIDQFDIVSGVIAVGGKDARYPYPDTENWQKAIGAHFIWLSASVKVITDPKAKTRAFTIKMTLHAEDMYNFNPGMKDIATGTPDSDNGRFELCGLGKEFLSVSTLTREITFTVPLGPLPDTRVQPPDQKVSR